MGCQNSKEAGSKPANNTNHEAKQNGGAGPGSPPAVDPRLPLNPRQLFLLKKSWKGVKRNMEATGVEMFIGLVSRLSPFDVSIADVCFQNFSCMCTAGLYIRWKHLS